MPKQVIAKYGPFIFRCFSFYSNQRENWFISFADFFEEDESLFFSYYKKLYPNHSLQVFKHKEKNLIKDIRLLIEEQIEHPYFLLLNRDFNLKKIFE
jgi:hypothetical protein